MSDNTSALDINKVFTFYTPTSWTKEDQPTHNLYPGYIIKKFANYTNADIKRIATLFGQELTPIPSRCN